MNYKELLQPLHLFEQIGACADELDLETYVIGGFVRDLFLKRASKDIDFVCLGSGISLAQKVKASFGQEASLSIFKNFGTARVDTRAFELEFVGARRESYQRESRKPIVEDGSLEDDQNRRDFTINALAICINKDNFGTLLDPFDGMSDMKKKMIRTPLDPTITFSDDPLRMMRAVRFAAQLKYDIEHETFLAIADNIDRMDIVSKERISDELNKIILSDTPSYGFKLLFHSGLLEKIFPEMHALQGVEVIDGKSHKDNFYHTLQVLDNISTVTDDLWLRWAAILHDIAKPPTKRFNKKVGWTFHGHEDMGARMVSKIFRRMKLPLNDRMKYVEKLVRLHLRPIALVKKHVTDAAIRRVLFEAGDDVDDLMKLCRADITSKNHDKVKQFLRNFDLVEQKMHEVEAKDEIRNFQPPIVGEEIMQLFNIAPGKVVGDLKEQIKEAIIEGEIENDHDQAYALLIQLAAKKGLKVND